MKLSKAEDPDYDFKIDDPQVKKQESIIVCQKKDWKPLNQLLKEGDPLNPLFDQTRAHPPVLMTLDCFKTEVEKLFSRTPRFHI